MGKFSRQIRWDVTRSVALASLFYFLFQGGKTCLFPFITLYFRRLGLTATQTGLITGSKSFVWYFAAPLWMILSRRVQKTKVVLGTALLIAIATNLTVTLIPPIDRHAFTKECNSKPPTMPSVFDIVTDATRMEEKANTSVTVVISDVSNNGISVEASAAPPADLIEELKTVKLTSFISSTPTATSKITSTTQTKTTSTTSTTTTTTTTTVKTTTMSYKQMAQHLLNRVKAKTGLKTLLDIQRFIAILPETYDWPKWKQKALAKQIVVLLNKSRVQDNIHNKNQNPKDSDTSNSSIEQPPTAKKPESDSPSAITTTLSTDTLNLVVVRLLPFYLKDKEKNPSLSVKYFVDHSEYTSSLSPALKTALKEALTEKLQDTASPPQRRSLSEDEDKNITSTDNVDTEHASNSGVIDILNKKTNASVAAMRNLVGDILPRLTENAPTFIIILIIIVAGEVISAPIDLLSDNSFYELLDELDSLDRYGKHKFAALLSVVIFGISVSVLIYFSPCLIAGTITRYHLHFYAFATLVGLAFLIIPFYPTYNPRPNSQLRVSPITVCPTCCGRTCSDCKHRLLLITVFLVGVVQAGMQDFILWDVQNLPQSSDLVFGSFVSANGFAAILAPIIGQKILSFIKPAMVGSLSLYCIAIQLLLCSFMTNAWFIVPLQLMNILGAPLLWAVVSHQTSMMTSWHENLGAVRRVDDVHVFAKASQKRALYTAYLCTYQGIAFAVGSVLSGMTYDLSGGSLVSWLRVWSVIIAVWASIYMMFHCCCVSRPKPKKYSKLLEDSEDEEVALYDMRDKNSNCTLGFSKSKAGYIQNGKKRIGGTRKKRRTKKLDSSSEDQDDLEQDWLAMAMRKDSRLL